MQLKIHEDRLKKAINDKKLILIQYSCTDLFKKPITITSFFALNYFTDEEFGLEGDENEFDIKLKKYFKNHKDYYFVLWNYNITYSFKNLKVFSETEITKMNKRTIDLDDVFELYAPKNNQEYIRKVKPTFDTRYYFALLNNLEIGNGWIWGGNEKSIKNYSNLLLSSRLKVKITARLINKYLDKSLIVDTNEKIIKKSKRILNFLGKLDYWKKNIKLIIIAVLIFLLGKFADLIINLIANGISK